MEKKPFWQSKTLWFNAVGGVVEFLSLTEFQHVIPQSWAPGIGLGIAAGNMILRKLTTQPIGT